MRVTPSESLGGYSPFNLTFGRKPRLSAVDICFPRRFLPAAVQAIKGSHRHEVRRLATNLKEMRFRALESEIEQKELL